VPTADGGDVAAAPPADTPPSGGYARAKWATERLALRCCAEAAAAVTLHRVGYLACPADTCGGMPLDAQGAVLAACVSLCAAPAAPAWALEWASLPRFAAALAAHVTAPGQSASTQRVVHHAGAVVPFHTALGRLRDRGLPAAVIDRTAWAAALRGGVAQEPAPHPLQHAAALLDAVGVDAACGAADVRLRASIWQHPQAEQQSSEVRAAAAGDAAAAYMLSPAADEAEVLMEGVLKALELAGMMPAERAHPLFCSAERM
jgi:thioester reductase-like protein